MPIFNDQFQYECYNRSQLGFGLESGALAGEASRKLFVHNLRLLTAEKGKSTGLAAYCGVAPETVSRWKRGANQPSFSELDKIATYLDVSIADLFRDPSVEMSISVAYRIVGEALKAKEK